VFVVMFVVVFDVVFVVVFVLGGPALRRGRPYAGPPTPDP